VLTLLAIEFLDEFVFGAREAAWPLIRDDLAELCPGGYAVGLAQPRQQYRRAFPRRPGRRVEAPRSDPGGGVFFALALLLTAASGTFSLLILSFALFYPASGAFVSLSQAALMDTDPARHEHNMARWTFAGSLGVVMGPLALGRRRCCAWAGATCSPYWPGWRC